MEWWVAGFWGLAGAASIDLVDLYHLLRTRDGSYQMPWMPKRDWLAYGISVVIRLIVGVIVACAMAGQLRTPLAALGVGAGAVGFMEHLVRGGRPSGPGDGHAP